MGTAIAIAFIALVSARAPAAPPERLYYLGEMKLSSPTGQSTGSQVFLLEKTYDRAAATIIERAIIVHDNGKAEEQTSRFHVKDDGTFTVSDDTGTIDGSGTLFGPAWKWTYFKATYRSTTGVRIDDENFMSDDSALTARKKLTGPDNKVFMYMEATGKSINQRTFEILRAGLMKK